MFLAKLRVFQETTNRILNYIKNFCAWRVKNAELENKNSIISLHYEAYTSTKKPERVSISKEVIDVI